MPAGKLDTELKLYAKTEEDDGYGGKVLTDGDPVDVWANIAPASWKQQQTMLGRNMRITHVITLRWDAELAALPSELKATFEDRGGVTRTLWVKTKLDTQNAGDWLMLGADEGGPA